MFVVSKLVIFKQVSGLIMLSKYFGQKFVVDRPKQRMKDGA